MVTDNVQVLINGAEKPVIMALARTIASGKQLPFFVLGNGKTPKSHQSQLGCLGLHKLPHSESGWMTYFTFKEYLNWLRGNFPKALIILCWIALSRIG
jgi:hypothetical protein